MRYSPFRHLPSILRKTDPIHLTVFLTRQCNARCPFCFYLRTPDAPLSPPSELTLDELRQVSGSIGNLLWLAFSGGEIYLREDLAEISRAFYRNNRPAIMLFPTNGMLPEVIRERTEDILRSCPKSIIAVKLSIDGVGEAHDVLRNTPGSFDRTSRTYRLLEDLLRYPNFELGVNTVMCADNQDAMDGIIDHVAGMRSIRTHTLSLARGTLAEERYKAVDPEKYARAITRLEERSRAGTAPTYRFAGARIKAAQDILQRRIILRTAQGERGLLPCYAGRLNIVLAEDGEVYPCEILSEGFGNVKHYGYDMRRVLRSEKARTVLADIRDRRCSCTHECYVMTNILFNPALYPALAKEYLRLSPPGA